MKGGKDKRKWWARCVYCEERFFSKAKWRVHICYDGIQAWFKKRERDAHEFDVKKDWPDYD